MIDARKVEELREIGKKLKELLPDHEGQVAFNCSRKHPEPKVTVTMIDVTFTQK